MKWVQQAMRSDEMDMDVVTIMNMVTTAQHKQTQKQELQSI